MATANLGLNWFETSSTPGLQPQVFDVFTRHIVLCGLVLCFKERSLRLLFTPATTQHPKRGKDQVSGLSHTCV